MKKILIKHIKVIKYALVLALSLSFAMVAWASWSDDEDAWMILNKGGFPYTFTITLG